MKVGISEIKVNRRIRKDTGDLDELARSMKEHGLINPVTITHDMVLLAGFRRLEAARLLGWESIECSVVDAPTRLEKMNIEVNENLYRKEFTEEEKALYEKELAYERSRGLRRVWLWLKRFIRKILAWLSDKGGNLFRKQ